MDATKQHYGSGNKLSIYIDQLATRIQGVEKLLSSHFFESENLEAKTIVGLQELDYLYQALMDVQTILENSLIALDRPEDLLPSLRLHDTRIMLRARDDGFENGESGVVDLF